MSASNTAFAAWFESQGFRHFGASEFESYFAAQRKGVKNSPPAKPLWKNIVPTLRIVDDLRESFGKPCRILSSYRSPDYNKTVGGAPLSQHMEFRALDIAFEGVSPQRAYDRLIEWRKAGRFAGGLGLYPSSGFVHIDTRGNNATWRGR
jgi:N-acetylmuramoyl-L-alanine amidase